MGRSIKKIKETRFSIKKDALQLRERLAGISSTRDTTNENARTQNNEEQFQIKTKEMCELELLWVQ